MRKTNALPLFFLLTFMLVYACATTEPVSDEDRLDPSDIDSRATPIFGLPDDMIAVLDEMEIEDLTEEEQNLYFTRSLLTDAFDIENHDMPEFYLQEIQEDEVDIYQGFRVQILSTRDVDLADSTQVEFETWADTTFADYSPRGYVHFRQPYYRVRIGDFHDRDRAIELSKLVKSRYPDAWIIHDRINPYRVPSDTLEIRIGEDSNEDPLVIPSIPDQIDETGTP